MRRLLFGSLAALLIGGIPRAEATPAGVAPQQIPIRVVEERGFRVGALLSPEISLGTLKDPSKPDRWMLSLGLTVGLRAGVVGFKDGRRVYPRRPGKPVMPLLERFSTSELVLGTGTLINDPGNKTPGGMYNDQQYFAVRGVSAGGGPALRLNIPLPPAPRLGRLLRRTGR